MQKRIKKKGICLLALCLLVLAIIFLYRGGTGGVLLYPESETELPEMVYFMQKDSRWSGDHLGQARDTMASSGCLVCSLAAGLDMQAILLEKDFYMTAGELNTAFSGAGVYTEQGAVIWDRIALAVPGTESYVADSVTAAEIDELLSRGIFPVVKVRMAGYGAWHWVLLTGTDEGGYLCMDPMGGTKEPVSLSSFGDRVYSMRAVYFGAS